MNSETEKIQIPLPVIQHIPDYCYQSLPTPITISDARSILDDLVAGLKQIETQLSVYKAEKDAGLETAHTKEWRISAINAKAVKTNQIKIIKTWLREAFEAQEKIDGGFANTVHIYSEVKELKLEVQRLATEVQELKLLLSRFVQHHDAA